MADGPRPDVRRSQIGLVLVALAAGIGVSVQVFLNGRLAEQLGSVEITAAANSGIGLGVALGIAWTTGALRRAGVALRRDRSLRPWHVIAGLNGAVFLTVTTAAAPRIGLALLTVALVCGQTVGGLLVDHLGFGPAGRKAITLVRVLGVGLAVLSVSIGAIGASGALRLPLLVAVVGVGVLIAIQQAGIGHVARVTGEPVVAGVANFGVGLVGTLGLALVVTGGVPPNGWASTPGFWLGGLLGVGTAVATGTVVREIGVLRFVLAFIAGQTLGALVVDLVAPAAGHRVTVGVAISVLVALSAVVVSERFGRAASAGRDGHGGPGGGPRLDGSTVVR